MTARIPVVLLAALIVSGALWGLEMLAAVASVRRKWRTPRAWESRR